MNGVGSKILNLGIDSNTSSELAQRIRFTNIIAVVGFVVTIVVGTYGILVKWPVTVLLGIWPIAVLIVIALILNHRKKNIAARLFILCLYNYAILEYSIIFGQELNYHFWSIPVIYATFLFFGNENKKLTWLMVGVNILVFVYLRWHFTEFKPLVATEATISNVLSIINNGILFLECLIIYSYYLKENMDYANTVISQSKELEEKNKHLEHFAHIAAHDLKEPLVTVNTFIDIIKEDYFPDGEQEVHFTHIQNAIARMRAMIDGLLKYSQIGKTNTVEYIDLNKLVNGIQVDLNAVIKEKNVFIKVNNLPKIHCLRIEMRQLFQNLIMNAIKFQPPGASPRIEISCVNKNTLWEFRIADNGIGISPRNLISIFQIFRKLHLRTEYPGQGIGLAFCKKIVEIHDGTIWVNSEQEKGSQFYFTISKNSTA